MNPTRKKITQPQLQAMKRAGERIVVVTAYDHYSARIVDAAVGWPAVGIQVEGVGAEAEVEILTTKERLPWSGHMAFPGGHREPADPDLRAAAIARFEEGDWVIELDAPEPRFVTLSQDVEAGKLLAAEPTAVKRVVVYGDFRREFGVQVIAIELPDGSLVCPPDPDLPLETKYRLVAIDTRSAGS